MNSLFWHDYETSGTDPARDRPLQFAGLRTDPDLQPLGDPVRLYCQPDPLLLPHPAACLITGITPQIALERGAPFARQRAQHIRAGFRQLARLRHHARPPPGGNSRQMA